MKILIVLICTCLLSPALFAGSMMELKTQIEALQPKKLSSVLVMQDNQLLFESYFNGTKADDLHDIRSASKTLTSLMFGVAIKDGFFEGETDKVLDTFDNYKNLPHSGSKKQNMTYFDLLTMTGPLECDDMNNYSQGHEERMYLTYDWVGFFLNLPIRANPPWEPRMGDNAYGRDFSYCTAGISITAAAIEKQSGMRFSDYTAKTIFKPLGISEYQWQYNGAGITQGGGGLRIKPRDLLKIGQLVLNKGRWQGQQIIPRNWLDKSLRSYSSSIEELKGTYGITWWQFPYPYKEGLVSAFAAAGNGGNYLFVVPELSLAAVITSTAYNTPYMHKQTHNIFAKVILPAIAAKD